MNEQNPAQPPVPQNQSQPASEQAPVEAKPVSENDDFSRKFAILSRRERKLLEEEQRFKTEAKEWQEWKKWKESAKQKPLDYLKAAGLELDDLVKHVISDGQPPAIEDEVKSIKAEIEAYKKARAEEEERLRQMEAERKEAEVIDAYKKKIVEFIDQDKDRFEAIHTNAAYDDVFEVIKTYFEKTGEVLEIEKAADSVEQHLVEEFKAAQEKFGKLKKLAQNPVEPSKTEKHLSSELDKKSAPTLTNNITASSVASAEARQLSREESLKHAAKMLKWT